jgi:hypothetical protein
VLSTEALITNIPEPKKKMPDVPDYDY